MKVINDLKNDEGFRGNVYKDTEGFLSIGYGTKLPLTKNEATLLLNKRLNDNYRELLRNLDFEIKNKEVKDILANMSYQLGASGTLKFKKMLKAIKKQDYKKASEEMLDSLWAKQTPNRAKRLANEMRKI